jgi:hypothetical protein
MRRRRGVKAAGHRAIALVELIIAIGALAAVSIVVMQLFVHAADREHRARDLDMACFEAQGLADLCRVYGNPEDAGGILGRQALRVAEGSWETYYDADWNPIGFKPEHGFMLSAQMGDAADDGLRRLSVTVARIDPALEGPGLETVFSLPDIACWGRDSA